MLSSKTFLARNISKTFSGKKAYTIVQQKAPEFSAPAVFNGELSTVNSSDFQGKYWLLFFYPMDFTFVCPTEIIAFSERIEDFKKLGVEVVAASVDSVYSHLAWINTPREKGGLGQINFPIISDIKKDISKNYGVLLDSGVALRGSFIIDPLGVIRHATLNDLPIGRSVDEAIRLIEALKFADEHGEVCPANWRPGKETIKPNPVDSKSYFESANKN